MALPRKELFQIAIVTIPEKEFLQKEIVTVTENWCVILKKREKFTEIVEYDNDNHKE